MAVIWFIAGLAADHIYFYPPLLAILGGVAIFNGQSDAKAAERRRARAEKPRPSRKKPS